MNSLVLLILVAAAVAVHANSAYDTPAARFWEKALPGTRMPEAIADLAQEGTDHSPLKEHRAAPYLLPSECLRYGVGCPSGSKAMPPGLFFLETQARVGSTMTVSFSPAAVPPILPRDAAKTVPFGNLADVLATFNIAASSGEAEKIGNTLTACKTSVPGEKMMTCTTSVEATVESAVHMLVAGGKNNDDGVVWAAASGLSRHGLPRQAYVLDAVTALDGDRHVACHAMPFPYAVFQCHMTDERSKAYTMTLQGLQGGAHGHHGGLLPPRHIQMEPGSPGFRDSAHQARRHAGVPLHALRTSALRREAGQRLASHNMDIYAWEDDPLARPLYLFN